MNTMRGVCEMPVCAHMGNFVPKQKIDEAGWNDPKDYRITPIHVQYDHQPDCYMVERIDTLYKVRDFWLCRKHARELLLAYEPTNHEQEYLALSLESDQV